MTTTERQELKNLNHASVSLLRSKLNQGANWAGILGARTTGQIVQYLVLGFLIWHLFLFLNVALGLYLASVYELSSTLGVLIVAGIYALLLLLYLLIRSSIQMSIQNRMARRFIALIDTMNHRIDTEPWLVVDPAYREEYIFSDSNPYDALERRALESRRKAEYARLEVERGVHYVQDNYASLAIGMVGERLEQVVPAYRYVAPIIRQFGAQHGEKQTAHREARRRRGKGFSLPASAPSLMAKGISLAAPYVPYLQVAYTIVKPVLSAFLIAKTRGVLSGMLGLRRKRK